MLQVIALVALSNVLNIDRHTFCIFLVLTRQSGILRFQYFTLFCTPCIFGNTWKVIQPLNMVIDSLIFGLR